MEVSVFFFVRIFRVWGTSLDLATLAEDRGERLGEKHADRADVRTTSFAGAAPGAFARRGARERTSETLMSSRMFCMRFNRGCRRCPRSFPNGAVLSVARQLGQRGFWNLRRASRSISCAQSRWKQCPHAWSFRTTSAPGPGRGRASRHSVHTSGPSTRERVPQQAMARQPWGPRMSRSRPDGRRGEKENLICNATRAPRVPPLGSARRRAPARVRDEEAGASPATPGGERRRRATPSARDTRASKREARENNADAKSSSAGHPDERR